MEDSAPGATLVPIGRFARLAGLSVPQLRHYDRRGLLVPVARDRRSGYRYYSEAQAAAARAIALLRSIDVPLADIQELLGAPEPERVRRVFAEHRQRVERRLGEARTALESIDQIIREGELMEASESCSFCGRTPDEARTSLAAGAARICHLCVGLAREVIELDARDPTPRPAPRPTEELPEHWHACAFCGRDKTQVRKLVAGPTLVICDGCLDAVAAA
ncbi:MAG: MerR family transcriptional regulator [Chloroflexi bacterium]|nr:MAG: MerR family transcriptional regulator [Chloroflexota bacterium]